MIYQVILDMLLFFCVVYVCEVTFLGLMIIKVSVSSESLSKMHFVLQHQMPHI